jgi:hypothetical protein
LGGALRRHRRDTFDFALDRETLHLSMTDAMGHAVNASVLAIVLVAGHPLPL